MELIMKWQHFKTDIEIKPAPMTFFRGALPLKVLCQMCLALEIMLAMTYAGIFVVLETYAWFPMMFVFTTEAGLALI